MKRQAVILFLLSLFLVAYVSAGSGIGRSYILDYFTLDQTYAASIGGVTGSCMTGTCKFHNRLLNYSFNQDKVTGDIGFNTSIKSTLFTSYWGFCELIQFNRLDTLSITGGKWEAASGSRVASIQVNTSGCAKFTTSSTGASIAGNDVNMPSGSCMQTNRPYLLCGFYNSTHNILVNNGTVVAATDRTNDGLYETTGSTWAFGASQNAGVAANPCNCSVDEIMMFNFSSDAQVNQFLTNGSLSKLTTDIHAGVRPYDVEYYVCPNGSDSNSGLSVDTAIKSITKLNQTVTSGDCRVNFCRGGVWRLPYDSYLTLYGGCEYKAYGSESLPMPKFYGSKNGTHWDSIGGNKWKNNDTYPDGVGSLFFNDWTSWGIYNVSNSATRQGEFYLNSSKVLVMYSASDPDTYYDDIEITVGIDMFDGYKKTGILFDNIEAQGGGRHCFSIDHAYTRMNNTKASYCGGDIDSGTLRLGNCYEYGMNSSGWIRNATALQCYDAALTPQCWNEDGVCQIANLSITYSIAEKSHYDLEFFTQSDDLPAVNLLFDHLTLIDSGYSFSTYPNYQRSDVGSPAYARGMRIARLPSGSRNISFTNIILYNSSSKLWVFCESGALYCAGSSWYLNNNLYWKGGATVMFDWVTNQYNSLAAFRAGVAAGNDSNSIELNNSILFVDRENGDYRPISTSVACTMSTTGSYVGALPCAENQAPTVSGITPANNTIYKVNYTSPTVAFTIAVTGVDVDQTPYTIKLYNNTNGGLLCTSLYNLSCAVTLGLNEVLNYNVSINDSSATTEYGVYKVTASDNTTYYSYMVNITDRNTGSLVNGTVDFEGTIVAVSAANYNRTTYKTTETVTFYKAGYINQTDLNHATTANLKGWLYPVQVNNITHAGFIVATNAYVRNLTYTVNYTCWNISATKLDRYINNTLQATHTLTCNNTPITTSFSYQHGKEGEYNISFLFNTTHEGDYINRYYANGTYISDLNNPDVALSYNLTSGFSNATLNITLVCTDNIYTTLGYNKTYNDVLLFNGTLSNNTRQSNITTTLDGTNVLFGRCSDLFGNTTETETFTVYRKILALIDERTGDDFEVMNLTSVKAYYDDNHTYYDFQTANYSRVNFTSLNNDKLRIELEYSSGAIIVRYIDVSLVNASPIRICANLEGVTYYEQLITSSTEQGAVLSSVYADCVIAADYTRFAYQNAKTLKAYSINTMYYLYTWDSDGNQITLASVDGSIASYINIDALQFLEEQVDVGVSGEAVGFNSVTDTMVSIRYVNVLNENTALTAVITRTDTGATLLDTDEFTDPNNATIYLDTAALTGVNSTTMFKLVLTKTTKEGTETITEYFNIAGSVALISAGVAVVICLLNILFGLSLTSANTTFSWLGIIFMGLNLIICGLAASAWYVTFMAAISAIILVFIVLIMLGKNIETIGA